MPSETIFTPKQILHLPNPVQRYLNHSITPGTPLASAVRLRMQGKIKLKTWCPFQAEQVIAWNRGMIWQAIVWMNGVPVLGFDRLLEGAGTLRWKLLGLLPVMSETGNDITRSSIGRMKGESVWLPSVLANPDLLWIVANDSTLQTHLSLFGEITELRLTIDDTGKIIEVAFPRWGNYQQDAYCYHQFGGYMQQEGEFGGYRIPTKILVGWNFGEDSFEENGAFFCANILEAVYR